MGQKIELTLPNRSESLIKVADFILRIGAKAKLSQDELQDILIAVDEACSNIICYAFEKGEEANFTIACQIKATKITFCLINQGKRFDPTSCVPQMPSKTTTDLVGTIQQGRGLFFMHRFMDELKYEYHPQKGNILYMIKYKGGIKNVEG